MFFKDRSEAGKLLASKLGKYKNDSEAIIIGLPRGGVVTAAEVAQELKLPLDIIVPRKIVAPGSSELAIGAITLDGSRVFNEDIISMSNISQEYIEQAIKVQEKEAQRRIDTYRKNRPPLILKDKVVIIVDDGVATGATIRAAIMSAKKSEAKKVIAAIPVIAQESLRIIRDEVNELIYLDAPLLFGAIGAFYANFEQVNDDNVIDIMNKFKS